MLFKNKKDKADTALEMIADEVELLPPEDEDDEDEERRVVNLWYAGLSGKFRSAKLICAFSLAALLLLMLFTTGDALTYSSLSYMARDLGEAMGKGGMNTALKIEYPEDGDMDFALLGSELAVAGESGVTLWKSTGAKRFLSEFAISSPKAVSGIKYFAVYSLGGNTFHIFNSLTRVYSATLDYPIYGMAMAEGGTFALLSKSREYKSCVYVYDDDFNLKASCGTNDYIADTALSPDGKILYIVSFAAAGLYWNSELCAYSVTDGSLIFECGDIADFPLKLFSFEGGGVCLAGEEMAYFIDSEGKTKGKYPYGGKLSAAAGSGNKVAFALDLEHVTSAGILAVISSDGRVLASAALPGAAEIAACGEVCAALVKGELICISGVKSYSAPAALGTGKLIVYGDTVYMCTPYGTYAADKPWAADSGIE